MKEHHRKILLTAVAVLLAMILCSCSAITGSVEVIDQGWTIKDNGQFSYAFILQNNGEEPASYVVATVDGYDQDGSRIGKGDWENTFDESGTLRPGEKTAVCMSFDESVDSSDYETVPSSFRLSVQKMPMKGEFIDYLKHKERNPYITIENTGHLATFKNHSDEDYDDSWVYNGGEPQGESSFMFVTAVFRDDEGNIIGASRAFPDGDSIQIAAGEEKTMELYCQNEMSENVEFYIHWN